MFSNLSKGNVLYGLDRRDKVKWFTASVERITPSYSNNITQQFGTFPELILELIVNINGEQRTFQQVPSNNVIADFGEKSFVIADNKDSLYNYTKKLLQDSEKIVDSVSYHEAIIPQYKDILNEIMPGSANSEEVKGLKNKIDSLEDKLAKAIALLESRNIKKDD